MLNSDFWSRAEHDFHTWNMALHGLNIPSVAELDRYWASLTSGGDIQSSLREQVQTGYMLYPGDENRQELLRDALSNVRDTELLSKIEKGISNKICDSDFFWAWTAYQRSMSTILALETTSEASQKEFNQKSSQKSSIVQRYIYAHWMYERWAKPSRDGIKMDKNAHIIAQQDLAYEISEAIKHKPLSPNEKNWLRSMIGEDGEDPRLKGKILNLTAKQICELVEIGGLKKDELPPLSY